MANKQLLDVHKPVSRASIVMRGDIKKLAIKRSVLRTIALKDRYGNEILEDLRLAGIQPKSNYLYEILSEMEKEGLIRGRWSLNSGGRPSRHYYGLAEGGEKELDHMVWESFDLINERVLLARVKETPGMLDAVFSKIDVPAPTGKFVAVLPESNPAVSYWLHLHSQIATFQNTTLYVVKPPNIPFPDPPSGITVLDGRRSNLPLKDGFADYLLMAGLPADSGVEETLEECARILNNDGHLILKHPNSLSEDRSQKSVAGYEYFANLLYEIYDRDGMINFGIVLKMLSRRFQKVSEGIFGGSTWIHAYSKKMN